MWKDCLRGSFLLLFNSFLCYNVSYQKVGFDRVEDQDD